MRIERLVTLELSEAAGQGRPSEPGRLVRGVCLLGDRPDLRVDISARCVMEPFATPLLERARVLAAHPVQGINAVVDIATGDSESFVAYRWIAGRSLAQLLVDASWARERAMALLEALRTILERVARSPLAALPSPSTLALEQILIDDSGEPLIVDWALASAGVTFDAAALLADLRRRIVPEPTSARTPSKPRGLGFDAALGAALSGADEPVAQVATPPSRTRALPQLSWPAISAAPPPRTMPIVERAPVVKPSAEPRPRASIVAMLVSAIVGIVLGVGAMATIRPQPAPVVAAPTPSDLAVAVAQPTAMIVAANPSIVPAPIAKPATRPAHAVPVERSTSALLSVRSDVPAAIYVDGKYLGDTPLVHQTIESGAHHLRLEALEQSMRLLPQETDVTLAPGTERKVNIELR